MLLNPSPWHKAQTHQLHPGHPRAAKLAGILDITVVRQNADNPTRQADRKDA
jgi:hypothetical protein